VSQDFTLTAITVFPQIMDFVSPTGIECIGDAEDIISRKGAKNAKETYKR